MKKERSRNHDNDTILDSNPISLPWFNPSKRGPIVANFRIKVKSFDTFRCRKTCYKSTLPEHTVIKDSIGDGMALNGRLNMMAPFVD